MISKILHKFHRKLIKLRLQPIRVFCLHHVCEQFDVESMCSCDWMALSEFKEKINALRSHGYKFISLTEAYIHLNNDWIRRKKYTIITFDDGNKSLSDLLPWLEEQNIPVTLFVNGKYLDGKSYRETPKEQYFTYDELFLLNSHLIEIGHHGWEHTSVYHMNETEFKNSIERNIELLSKHPRYIPFWAYTWGHNNDKSNYLLKMYNITPVVITGGRNYNFNGFIDRELL